MQSAGQCAQAWLHQQIPGRDRALALDEQYSSKRGEAYLNVVDMHSAQVWATLPAMAVDEESWTLVLWYLQEQGGVVGSCDAISKDVDQGCRMSLQKAGRESPRDRSGG